jgi:hypothetical protein
MANLPTGTVTFLLKAKMKGSPISFMSGMTTCLGTGYSERFGEHLDTAKQHFEEGLNIFKQPHHKGFENLMRAEIGHTACMQGDTSEPVKTIARLLFTFKIWGIASPLHTNWSASAFLRSPMRNSACRKTLRRGEALRERIDNPMTEHERVEYDQSVAQLRGILPEAGFNTLREKGKSITMERTIQPALS